MNRFWVGGDVSKRKIDVALMDERSKYKSRVFENTSVGHAALMNWLVEHGAALQTTHVCMESTGPYSEAPATALVDAGWRVSVVNPARVKGFAQGELSRNKTDKSDAKLLARFCKQQEPEAWQPAPLEYRQLRALVDRLVALKEMHQQECNRLESHELGGHDQAIASVQQHLDWLDQRIRELQRQIDDHIDGNPQLRRDAELMQSIPGVGATTISRVMAYVGDIRRFKSAKALAAFIGVTPMLKESGSSVKGRTMISRIGHKAARQALYMPGVVAMKYNPTIKAMRERLLATGLAKKAIVCASMRKLVHQIFAIVKSGKPFDPSMGLRRLDFQDGI